MPIINTDKTKAVITILGTAGTKYNSKLDKYQPIEMQNRANYIFFDDENLSYHNTFPLLIEKYEKEYNVIAIYTKEAKQAQEDILKLYDFDYNFDNNFLIKDPNDDKGFFAIINEAIKDYDEVIFDVSHGFRHLPLLALISLIVENIENPKKIKKVLFAQEKITFKEYKFIDLKDYLNISNIALILRSFLSTYKVPELDMDIKIYKVLKDFSIHLTSNQFNEIFTKDIQNLKTELKTAKNSLFFVSKLLDELEVFVTKIEDIKNKSAYEKFLFFAKLFMDKGYMLHSSTYLIEGITYYIADALSIQKYINFDTKLYENQTKIVGLLKLNYSSKDFNFPNEYFIDINIEKINKFYTLRNNIAEIRHNLAHINIDKTYDDIENDLKKYIVTFDEFIAKKEFYSFDKTLDKKYFTVRFLLKQYYKEIKTFANNQDKISKLETIIKKYNKNSLNDLTTFDHKKLKVFCEQYSQEIETLLHKKQNRKYLISFKEIQKLTYYQKIKSYYTKKVTDTTSKVMLNSEQNEAKRLKKKTSKLKIIQTREEKELLKDAANKLADLFNQKP